MDVDFTVINFFFVIYCNAAKIANPEINPGLFEGDIAGFHPNAVYIS